MVSSPGGDDYSAPASGPAPPSGMIAPQGGSTPFQPRFVNFLGDTNQPSTGLTPDMLAQIMASNRPQAAPPATGLRSGADIQMDQMRNQLAALTARKPQQQPQMQFGRNGSAGGGGPGAGGGMGGGWGGR